MASSTCARRCASAGVRFARAASAAPGTAGRAAGGEAFGFVVNRPQVVVGGGGGGRIGGMVMAMECWRSPMMVQAQLMSCCAKVDNPPPREVSFRFFLCCCLRFFCAMCRRSKFFFQDSALVRSWRMIAKATRVKLLSRFPLGITCVLEVPYSNIIIRGFNILIKKLRLRFWRILSNISTSQPHSLWAMWCWDFRIVRLECRELHTCCALPISATPPPREVSFRFLWPKFLFQCMKDSQPFKLSGLWGCGECSQELHELSLRQASG